MPKFKPNTGFKMKSPLRNTEKGKDKPTEKPDSMWGLMSKDDTKMINEKGNWVSLTRGSEGVESKKRYEASKKKESTTSKKKESTTSKKSATPKKSPYKAGQTAGQIIRRERHMV